MLILAMTVLLIVLLCACLRVTALIHRDDVRRRHVRVMRPLRDPVMKTPVRMSIPPPRQKPSAIVDHDEIWGSRRSRRSN